MYSRVPRAGIRGYTFIETGQLIGKMSAGLMNLRDPICFMLTIHAPGNGVMVCGMCSWLIPDVNPVEHLWDTVQLKTHSMNVQLTNRQQLFNAIMST